MRRVWRWFRRIVVALLALGVLAVATVLILLHTAWGRGIVQRRVQAALQSSFPGSTIGAITGSVLGTLVVHDVMLMARDDRELVSIKELELEVALLPLFGKTARVDSLKATGVQVHARPLPPAPLDPEDEPTGWTIELPRVEVHEGTVTIEATGDVVRDLDVLAEAVIPAGGPIEAAALVRGLWNERELRGFATATVGDDLTGFVSLGLDGGSLVASDIAVRRRSGRLIAQLPAADLAALVPMVPVKGDVLVIATAMPPASAVARSATETHVTLAASVGAARIDAVALVDPEARTARGVFGTSGLDLAAVTGARVSGGGRAVVAAVTDGTRVRATVIASGTIVEVAGTAIAITEQAAGAGSSATQRAVRGGPTTANPPGGRGYSPPSANAVIAVDGDLARAEVLAFVTGDGDTRVALVGAVKRDGETLMVEHAELGASVVDPRAASAGRAPVQGALAIQATASGPTTALAVRGNVSGVALRYDRVRVARLVGTFRGTLDAKPRGSAHVELGGVVNAGKLLGSVTADAANRADGTVSVRARGRAAMAPVVAEVSATVTLGDVIAVALGRHRVDTPAGSWIGSGGRVRVEPRAIVVTGIRSSHAAAWVTVDARIGRGTGALSATLEAHDVPVAAADARYRGTVTAALALTRTRGRWSGEGMVSGTGLQVRDDIAPIAAAGTIGVEGRRVAVALNATSPELGGARVGLEVEGPADVLDVDGWMRVARTDLHVVTVGLDRVDVAAVSKGRTAGTLDGTLQIREGVPTGTLLVRGVPTPAGSADADLTLALTDVGFVDAKATANVGAVGAATLGTRLAIPDHPFDPAAWRALGTRVVHSATAEAKDIVIDPKLLAAFEVDAPYRGMASVNLELGPGASSATLGLDVRDITGGPLARSLDVHVGATADANGTRGSLRVGSGITTLATVDDAATPVTLARWISDARSALTAPLAGTLVIGKVDATTALAIVGRTDVTGGSVEGRIKGGGTLGTPTAVGTVDLANITVVRRFTSKPPPALTALHVDASWGGASGHVRITGDEEGKGSLLVDARGNPSDPTTVFGMIEIKKFDLSPVVVFLPGPLAGAAGTLEADLRLRGVDPSLGTVRGTLTLTDGMVPIAPAIGTMRNAAVTLSIADAGITAKLTGRLGAGSITLTATADPAGIETVVDATLSKVSPIGALQPILDATVHGKLRRSGLAWAGTATISRASVEVPSENSHELLDSAVPADLIFVDLPIPRLPLGARAPQRPFLVLDVDLEPTRITVPEFAVDAVAGGKVTVSVGETVGLDGKIVIERGNADLFGHRYRVDLGQLAFDGTTDGLLDLKLAHDFPDVTMFVRFAGRLSELSGQEPEFSSQPGVYTPGQLLGFFLGGEPGGDPSKQTREAAVGFGAALASSRIGKKLKKYLPINIDVLRCDPGATSSSASCTLGTWVTRKVFLSYKQRLEGRYDENSYEGAVEWHFLPSWELDLSGGDRNYYGGDVLWRRRW